MSNIKIRAANVEEFNFDIERIFKLENKGNIVKILKWLRLTNAKNILGIFINKVEELSFILLSCRRDILCLKLLEDIE